MLAKSQNIHPCKTRTPAQEYASKSTSFPGTLFFSGPPFLGEIHVGNEIASRAVKAESEREKCPRKELPTTVKDLYFENVIAPEVNKCSPKGTKIGKKVFQIAKQ